MTQAKTKGPMRYDPSAVGSTIDNITASLERVLAGFTHLRVLLVPDADATELDPKDPANKYDVGGVRKLTPQGVDVCYRLFDSGRSRYAVSSLMGISFGAADHRYAVWKKLGGVNRAK